MQSWMQSVFGYTRFKSSQKRTHIYLPSWPLCRYPDICVWCSLLITKTPYKDCAVSSLSSQVGITCANSMLNSQSTCRVRQTDVKYHLWVTSGRVHTSTFCPAHLMAVFGNIQQFLNLRPFLPWCLCLGTPKALHRSLLLQATCTHWHLQNAHIVEWRAIVEGLKRMPLHLKCLERNKLNSWYRWSYLAPGGTNGRGLQLVVSDHGTDRGWTNPASPHLESHCFPNFRLFQISRGKNSRFLFFDRDAEMLVRVTFFVTNI